MARLALIILIVLLVFGVLLGGGWMSTHSVIQPGQSLFFLQRFTEQVHTLLLRRPINKLTYLLEVLDWRTDDMVQTYGKPTEIQALATFNQVLDEMALTASVVDYHDRPSINLEIKQRMDKIRNSLAGLIIVPSQYPEAYKAMQAKLNSLERVLNSEGLSTTNVNRVVGALVPLPAEVLSKYPGAIDPAGNPRSIERLLVPFPNDPKGVFHTFFPWEGTHITLKCELCHTDQAYAKIPSECNACHAQITPENHYPGNCSTCHTPTSWKAGYFDHANPDQLDCQSCHESMRPPGHSVGQCSLCHQPGGDWQSGSYNHPDPQNLDCKSCHEKTRPATHYGWTCYSCHDTKSWNPVRFDHVVAGATDCQSCHAKIRPANHYPLQCSNCHQTGSGWKGASFNHPDPAKLDCHSCHAATRPANHYAGQCSTCHTAGTTWKGASFDHAGGEKLDCQLCHEPQRPANHYAGQCVTCHSVGGAWTPATFDHKSPLAKDCASCHANKKPKVHFDAQCSACHDAGVAWKPAHFNHTAAGAFNCIGCHAGAAPAGHYSFQCSICHSPGSWKGAVFNHPFNMDHNGAGGKCQMCHPAGPPDTDCRACHDSAGGGGD